MLSSSASTVLPGPGSTSASSSPPAKRYEPITPCSPWNGREICQVPELICVTAGNGFPLFLRGNRLGLREQQEIIPAAGLGIGAGHIEASERVHPDQCAGALAVEVQVANVVLFFSPFNTLRVLRVERTS